MGHLQLVKVSSVTLVQFVFMKYTHINPMKTDDSGCEVKVVIRLSISHYTEDTGPTDPPPTDPPPTTCPDLPSLTNGMITYSEESPGSRPFLSTATYSCNTGYTLNGGSTTRTCGSGVWSGSPPVCQRKWNELCTVCLLSVLSPIQLTALTCPH